MNVTAIASALPPISNTGWGVASRRITEELGNLTWVMDLRTSGVLASDVPTVFNTPVLQAVSGPKLTPMYPHLSSSVKRVGYSFIEDIDIMRVYALNAPRHFDHIVCGSNWAANQMRQEFAAVGVKIPVSVAIQGVDSSIFKPYEARPGYDPNWFTIWSAGKFEYRKSQDVVIKAAGILMKKHADVRLFTSWSNPWPASRATMEKSTLIKYTDSGGGPDFISIRDACSKHLDLERTFLLPNGEHGDSVADIHKCDVGLFLSRCEAGTNLPLMEAMSCGLPVIATRGTGHADVMQRCHLGPKLVNTRYQDAWQEPDVDEVVDQLEWFYAHRRDTKKLAELSAQSVECVSGFTWEKCAKSMLEACQ